jgi:hypothetical protein
MNDDVYVDDAEEIDLDEAGRLAYSAVVRRLRNDETKPVGDTALSKFATFYVEMAERQRAKDEASRPNPRANVAEADDFLSSLRQMYAGGGITTARMTELVKGYVLLCEEHLESARAFAKELAADVPA